MANISPLNKSTRDLSAPPGNPKIPIATFFDLVPVHGKKVPTHGNREMK